MTIKYLQSQFFNKSLPILSALICITGSAMAQATDTTSIFFKKENVLSNVVITGQYKPTRSEDAVQRIRVIDHDKIVAMGAQNLRDVLLNEMNVTVAQDNVLGSSVQIQGISGQNVKILVDGVPVIGQQNGNIDISQLNVYNVDRIELIEGPMSVNYGTDALAGTINIISKSTQKNTWETGINTYYETIGKYNVNANVGYHNGSHTILLSGARNFFDGWTPGEPTHFFGFRSRPADSTRAVSWDPKEEYHANLQYIYSIGKWKLRYKLDYFYDKITNRGFPIEPLDNRAFDDYYTTYRFNNTLFLHTTILKNKNLNFLAAYNQYKRIKNTYSTNLNTLEQTAGSASDQDTSKYSLFNTRATLSTNNINAKINYEAGYDINIEKGYGVRILNKEQQIGDYAAYASLEYKLTDSITLRPGLRYAYNTAFDAPLIPSINIKYQINKRLVVRASYARGFRAPNVKELYFEFKDSNHDIVGNPDLKPEKSNNYNVATTYSITLNHVNYKIELSGFYNSISNMISLAQPDTTRTRYTYVNIDQFKTKGLQLNLTAQYKNLTVAVGGSYIGRYNQLYKSEAATVSAFSYAPELRCNLNYALQKIGVNAALFLKHTGKVPGYGLDSNNKITLTSIEPYTIADFSLSKLFCHKTIAVSIGCKNIFNTINISQSISSSNSVATAHNTGNSSLSIGTGRSYFIGIGYKFSNQ
jgi:outer membrane receptor for ferrienterochelin and colicins